MNNSSFVTSRPEPVLDGIEVLDENEQSISEILAEILADIKKDTNNARIMADFQFRPFAFYEGFFLYKKIVCL